MIRAMMMMMMLNIKLVNACFKIICVKGLMILIFDLHCSTYPFDVLEKWCNFNCQKAILHNLFIFISQCVRCRMLCLQ